MSAAIISVIICLSVYLFDHFLPTYNPTQKIHFQEEENEVILQENQGVME